MGLVWSSGGMGVVRGGRSEEEGGMGVVRRGGSDEEGRGEREEEASCKTLLRALVIAYFKTDS